MPVECTINTDSVIQVTRKSITAVMDVLILARICFALSNMLNSELLISTKRGECEVQRALVDNGPLPLQHYGLYLQTPFVLMSFELGVVLLEQ